MPKPYGWGKVQGVLVILGSFRLLDRDPNAESPVLLSRLLFAFNLVLGICILRRNRLILPLVAINVVLMVLSVIGASLTDDEFGPVYAIGVVVWALCAVYYYRRRSEFNCWL